MAGTRADARKARAEADERHQTALRLHEWRREVAQAALERIMDGASFDDADALLDQLSDLGAKLEVGG